MRTTVFSWGARIVTQASVLSVLSFFIGVAGADSPDSDPIQVTTELGITVEPSQIFDAFEESMDFWPALRKYVTSDNFTVAERDQRLAAAAYVKNVQDKIHAQLFGADETGAKDVVDYVTWGLRRAEIYRQLRRLIEDPRVAVKLRGQFEMFAREARRGNTPLDIAEAVARMDRSMQPLGLEPERQAEARELWRKLAECTVKINATQTAAIIQRADDAADTLPEGELVRKIASAADWAVVVKAGDKTGRQDFINAWQEINDQPVAEVATAVGE